MTPIVLHDFQQQLKNGVYNEWAGGARNVLAVLSTGGGKSILMSDIIMDGYNQGLTQSVIAHRNELVTQMSGHVAKRGIPHRIIGSKKTVSEAISIHKELFGQSFVHPTANTAVIGVDTLVQRSSDHAAWCAQNDRWFGDEWHHCLKDNKWGKAIDLFTNAWGLGVTATPCRADGNGLGRHHDGLMDAMVEGPNMRWLIENNFLSDYEVVCPRSDLTDHLSEDEVARSGDWSNQKLKKASEKSHIVGDVVENYIKYALGRKTIVFATDIETAGRIARSFSDSGVKAVALSGKTPSNVRAKYVREFKEGNIRVLVNVDLFDEGFDVPDCEVCIMARPTASLGKYRQMVGRALRYVPGKVALIIDQVSNIVRHGLPDKEVVWTLDRREKRSRAVKDPDDIPLTVCVNDQCAKPYERFRVACPYCGTVRPAPEGSTRQIEMVEGDLALLDRETLQKMREATVIENPADVARRVAHASGNPIAGKAAANRQIEKVEEHQLLTAALQQWAGIQRAKGLTDSEIDRKFYLTVGQDPLSALDGSKTRVEMEKLRIMIEGWYGHKGQSAEGKLEIKNNLVQTEIEKNTQGYRKGWLCSVLVRDLTKLNQHDMSAILKSEGRFKIADLDQSFNNERFRTAVYHADQSKDAVDFLIDNGYYPDLNQIACENGWVKSTDITKNNINPSAIPILVKKYGYVKKGNKKINGVNVSFYHKDCDKTLDDFFISSSEVNNAQNSLGDLINPDEKGFRDGWVSTRHLNEKNKTDKSIKKLVYELKKIGYHKIGEASNHNKGKPIYTTLYHRNVNADTKQFWENNL